MLVLKKLALHTRNIQMLHTKRVTCVVLFICVLITLVQQS